MTALPDRIHIFGASGSGTSTLAAAIAARFGHAHIDVDKYFWEPTSPPFATMRKVKARQQMLSVALDEHLRWVLSGSLCGWGDMFIPRMQLAIFLYLPPEIRVARLLERERERYGDAIASGGSMHAHHKAFIEWARAYDTGDESIRSLRRHERWIANLSCRCIRLEGALSTGEQITRLREAPE